MKSHIKNLSLLATLPAALALMLAGRVTAQTFTTLYTFTGGTDGAVPYAGLILSSNTLYGTANQGTVFKVNTDGTAFMTLHSFTATAGPLYTNSDGANPQAGLILSGNTLYGTANIGGTSGNGTVFKVNTDGTCFTTLHSFEATSTPYYQGGTNGDGATPQAGLILSGSTLYGTARSGGSSGNGTVFAVSTDGTGFTTLHNFTGGSDGGGPNALVLSSNTLYGTTGSGGSSSNGTVFAVNTNGTGFITLHSFTATSGANNTNSDGALPYAGLVLSATTLYGAASIGGSSGNGTVFKVNTDGTGFTTLHSFTKTGSSNGFENPANTDGLYPRATLVLSGKTLYGTASEGGDSGAGTLFAVNTDGTGFTTEYSFTFFAIYPANSGNSDGGYPNGLILSGNTLYGTAELGGTWASGTVFSLFIPPQLTIIPSRTNVILTWPTNATGFTLQSTTNLVSPAWTTNSLRPVVVNGQNTVTNPISGTQQFFRLSQ